MKLTLKNRKKLKEYLNNVPDFFVNETLIIFKYEKLEFWLYDFAKEFFLVSSIREAEIETVIKGFKKLKGEVCK